MRAHLAWILAVAVVVVLGVIALGRLPGDGLDLPAEQEPLPEAAEPRLLGAAPREDVAPASGGSGKAASRNDALDDAELVWREQHPLEITFFDAESGRVLDEVRSTRLVRPQANTASTVSIELAIDVPPGYVAWERHVFTHHDVPWAPRLRILYPLRREVAVHATLRRTDGRPLEAPILFWGLERGAWVQALVVGEATRVRGVPYFRGQHIRFDASDAGAEGSTSVAMPATSASRVDVGIELEPTKWALMEDEEIEDHVETDNDLLLPPDGDPPPPGAVDVAVIRHVGAPAVGVTVRLGGRSAQTDESGVAHFADVAVGEHHATGRVPGLLPLSAPVFVASGKTTHVELRESVGVTLEFEVVDEEGRPLPFAHLHLRQDSGIPWQDVQGDTLRLDRFTDEYGRRRLDHVEPGLIRFAALWGGWVKRGTVRARDGETLPLRLVLAR